MTASVHLEPRPGTPKSEPATTDRAGWIGVDLADLGDNRPARTLIPLVGVALILALGIAALRIDLIRTRYALATAMAEETRLIEEQRALKARLRTLRDPANLASLGHELGFVPSPAVRVLVDPMPSARADSPEAGLAPPVVSAGPPPIDAPGGTR